MHSLPFAPRRVKALALQGRHLCYRQAKARLAGSARRASPSLTEDTGGLPVRSRYMFFALQMLF
jgi:hypothetical protein